MLETENLDQRFAGDLPLVLLDENGEQITDAEVTLDSPTAYVVLPVVIVKDIPLTVNFLPGGGATTDDITYEINPKSLMVSGAERDMESLSEISLGSGGLVQGGGHQHLPPSPSTWTPVWRTSPAAPAPPSPSR